MNNGGAVKGAGGIGWSSSSSTSTMGAGGGTDVTMSAGRCATCALERIASFGLVANHDPSISTDTKAIKIEPGSSRATNSPLFMRLS
jgi:hypothetical protein